MTHDTTALPILNASYLTGKYHHNRQIIASYSVVSVPDIGDGWYFQGDSADEATKEIYLIWCRMDVTTEEAFDIWIENNLY